MKGKYFWYVKIVCCFAFNESRNFFFKNDTWCSRFNSVCEINRNYWVYNFEHDWDTNCTQITQSEIRIVPLKMTRSTVALSHTMLVMSCIISKHNTLNRSKLVSLSNVQKADYFLTKNWHPRRHQKAVYFMEKSCIY